MTAGAFYNFYYFIQLTNLQNFVLNQTFSKLKRIIFEIVQALQLIYVHFMHFCFISLMRMRQPLLSACKPATESIASLLFKI